MTSLTVPYGSPVVDNPHFAYPFTMRDAGAVVIEQGSIDDVFSCVQAIVNCQIGECPEIAGLGIPDLTFTQTPIDTSGVVQAVQSWEPRATESVITTMLDAAGDQWQLALTTSTAGAAG